MSTLNLEAFYGDPFAFIRSIEEFPGGDPTGMLTNGLWEEILSQNASYANRAIDFLHGVRFGNNPRGLRLIAKSGIGQTCEVIENYKYLFDSHSDDPVGLTYYGQTLSTEELVVVPNNEISNTQVQTIAMNLVNTDSYSQAFGLYFNGAYAPQLSTSVYPFQFNYGPIAFGFNPAHIIQATAYVNINITSPGTSTFGGTTVTSGQYVRLAFQDGSSGANGIYVFHGPSSAMTLATVLWADAPTVQEQLQFLANIGNNVTVTGGPYLVSGNVYYDQPYVITFTNVMSNQPLPVIEVVAPNPSLAIPAFSDGTFEITTSTGYLPGADEILNIPQSDLYLLQTAMDEIKSVTTIPTVHPFTSIFAKQAWNNVYASTEQTTVVRYVTGRTDINWPTPDSFHWIVGGVEEEAPRVESDPQHDYEGYHTVTTITSSSNQVGAYPATQQLLYPVLSGINDNLLSFTPNYALSPSPGGPTDWYITQVGLPTTGNGPIGIVDGIYPWDYIQLTGVIVNPQPTYWWSSQQGISGSEWLMVDFGEIQAINYLDFETTLKPYSTVISYDVANQSTGPVFAPVTPNLNYSYPDIMIANYNSHQPWETLSFYFSNGVDPVIFTRYVMIEFTRGQAPAAYGTSGWSIDIRNLRIGRIVG